MLTRLNKMMKNDDGFTLVELLIVVLIIGILAAIAIPVYIGIQTQAKHGAVKSDVNVTVKRVQVGLTEGAVTIPTTASSTPITGYSDSSARSDGDTVVTTPLGNGDFQVQGTGADGYTYTYSSVTGQFTEGSSGGVAFGGGGSVAPSITSATPTGTATVGTAYSYPVTATGTPSPTFTATGLPTGLSIGLTSGLISGTPSATGTFNYTIDAGNHVGTDATQTGTIVVTAPGSLGTYTYTYEDGTTQGWGNNTGTSMSVASNVSGHPKALSISGYLTNTYGNVVGAYVDPVGLPAYFTTGHTYRITYSYYMTSANAGGGGYITSLTMSAGQGNAYTSSGNLVYGAWTTVTTTWTQTTANQPFELKFNAAGYNGATVGMYIDDVTIQSTN